MKDPLANLLYPGEPTTATELTLLPVSPRRVLAAWPVLKGNGNGASGAGGNGHDPEHEAPRGDAKGLCLRIREVRDTELGGEVPGQQWSFDLADGQTGCLVELERPGLTVRAELVAPPGTNGAVPLARSRRVRLPSPEPVTGEGPIRWMIFERNGLA
jgi:hypothetical protein